MDIDHAIKLCELLADPRFAENDTDRAKAAAVQTVLTELSRLRTPAKAPEVERKCWTCYYHTYNRRREEWACDIHLVPNCNETCTSWR